MKIEVVFYSMYGHIYRMAEAVAGVAQEVENQLLFIGLQSVQ